MIEERELAMLTQVALPTLSCLEIFLGNCISGRTISREAWFNCFEVDTRKPNFKLSALSIFAQSDLDMARAAKLNACVL